LRVRVIVKPRSKSPGVEPQGGLLVVRVKSPPLKGMANEEARELLSCYFGISKSNVRLVSGHRSSTKVFEVEGL